MKPFSFWSLILGRKKRRYTKKSDFWLDVKGNKKRMRQARLEASGMAILASIGSNEKMEHI